jgi:hypothetical protein
MPTPLLGRPESHVGYIRERSNGNVTLTRFYHESYGGAIYPGARLMTISCQMNERLFRRGGHLFDQLVIARAYVEGAMAAKIKKTVREMQRF